ncbi:MAG: phage minor head protein, partial [Nocardioidaceae bacterium]
MADTREELEREIEPVAEQALQAWLAVALADVTGRAVDPTVVLRHASDWAERVHDAILPIVRASWLARFEAIADRPPSRSLIGAYLEAAANRMVRVPDEVAARIQRIVARNIGTSIPDMAALIDAELSFSGTANWPNRATVIARTESGGAWNGAAVAAYRADAQRLGIDLFKKWLATDDERTRETHNLADGQTVPLDASFTVGGFPMDYPCDPRGPAHEVINCRCAPRIGTAGELAFSSERRLFPVLPLVRSFAAEGDDMSDTVCI